MANSSTVGFGLVPVGTLSGNPIPPSTPMFMTSSEANNVFIGDPVLLSGTSNASVLTSGYLGGDFVGAAAGTLRGVILATAGAGNPITGIVTSVEFNSDAPPTGGPSYRRASTNAVVFVQTSRDVIYEGRMSGALAATDIGNNTDVVLGTGSTVTGRSATQISSAAIGTGATKQLRLIGVTVKSDDNDLTASYAVARVVINNSSETEGIAGVS